MTVDRPPQDLREGPESDREHDGLPPATVLSMCDRLLGEVGRRSHMFAWLRAPGSRPGSKAPPSGAADPPQWLAVDAYYPRSRLVVMCRPAPGPHDALYRELIPAHGLGLLTLDPAALGEDPEAVEAELAGKLRERHSEPKLRAPRSKPSRSGRNPDMAPVSSQAPQAEATGWAPVKVERTPVAPAVQHGLGVVVGMVLTAVLFAEIFLAVVMVALGAGRPLLGLAIALEACSRGLGTVAAERAGERAWASACAIGGAPVVAWFALAPRPERPEVEQAPLAGVLAVLAGGIALLALLIGS